MSFEFNNIPARNIMDEVVQYSKNSIIHNANNAIGGELFIDYNNDDIIISKGHKYDNKEHSKELSILCHNAFYNIDPFWYRIFHNIKIENYYFMTSKIIRYNSQSNFAIVHLDPLQTFCKNDMKASSNICEHAAEYLMSLLVFLHLLYNVKYIVLFTLMANNEFARYITHLSQQEMQKIKNIILNVPHIFQNIYCGAFVKAIIENSFVKDYVNFDNISLYDMCDYINEL